MSMLLGFMLYLLFVAVVWPLEPDRFVLSIMLMFFAASQGIAW